MRQEVGKQGRVIDGKNDTWREREMFASSSAWSDRSVQHKMPQLWTELLKDVSAVQSCQPISDLIAGNTCCSPDDISDQFCHFTT